MASRVQVPVRVRASALVKAREREARAEAEAAATGPFVYLPPMDPEPVPPADDAVFEDDRSVLPVARSGEELRKMMAQFRAKQL